MAPLGAPSSPGASSPLCRFHAQRPKPRAAQIRPYALSGCAVSSARLSADLRDMASVSSRQYRAKCHEELIRILAAARKPP